MKNTIQLSLVGLLVASASALAAADEPYKSDQAKRIIDNPIVRSSKGCVAFLGQDKRGLVIVSYPRDAKGKPICQRDLAYGDGVVPSKPSK